MAGSSRSDESVNRSNEDSGDCVYDQDSRHDGFMSELSEDEIHKRVTAVESGLAQITLKKCAYSLGFEGVRVDLSRESLGSNNGEEGYSNRSESPSLQIQAWENCEWVDEVFESGVRKAIGTVTGTDSSSSVEKLLGIFNKQKGVSKAKCPPGDTCVILSLDPNTPVEGLSEDTVSIEVPNMNAGDENPAEEL